MRKFKPKKKFPKDELINFLESGYTLQEIADNYGVAKSYISEYLKYVNISLKDIDKREKKMKDRRDKINSGRRSFINEFYNSIRGEINGR